MKMENDISELLHDSFLKDDPWLPRLTHHLEAYIETLLLKPLNLTLATYTTGRYFGSANSFDVKCKISILDGRDVVFEDLPPKLKKRYEELGIEFSDANELRIHSVCKAFEYLKFVPTLYFSVSRLIRVIHFLDAGDDCFDISHSDPKLPFSVFISVPSHDDEYGPIRVLESLVHEAMHLQFSIVERIESLYLHGRAELSSPWRNGELRPPSGLLHGIYVFSVISSMYALLQKEDIGEIEKAYLPNRISQIKEELFKAFHVLRTNHLTRSGNLVLDRLQFHFETINDI